MKLLTNIPDLKKERAPLKKRTNKNKINIDESQTVFSNGLIQVISVQICNFKIFLFI